MIRVRTAVRTWRTLLAATGVHASLVPLALGLVATVIWRNGVITAVGPLTLASVLPVVVAVPTLLGVACGISHVPPRIPVIVKNSRTILARAISHLTVLVAGLVVIALGALVGPGATFGPAVRNLMVFSAAALLAAALAGPVYAWMPVVVLFGMGVLSNPDEATWTVHGLVMAQDVRPGQLLVVVPLCLGAVAIAALDLRGLAYLPRVPRSAG